MLTLSPVLAPAPAALISSATANIRLSWSTMASDFVLEESTNLVNWYPVPGPMTTNFDTISAQMPTQGNGQFFRLRHQVPGSD
jgi:hypothetical protein